MIKKSASRNQRSKGAKVKHVLQILLPLCICFWLLYQIKRSYDRNRDMTEKDSKELVNGNDEDVGLKLGRKDLHAKRREEEDKEEGKDEDENNRGDRDDVEVDEDEIRQEIERNEERERQEGQKEGDEEAVDNREEEGREEEEDNNEMDEVEDERGGDNADLNEAGEEGTEVETTDPEDDFLDEDKGGREERVNDTVEEDEGEGRREEQVQEDDRSEDKDQDEVGENSHEAREVHYREDDASSAVAHNTEADNGSTDLGSNTPGMESNSTVSIPHDWNQESLEATPSNKEEGKSSVSEVVDNQASNVVAMSNVSETVTSLPLAQSLMTPDSGSGEVSLGQVTGVKMSNASMDEKTANVSAVTNSSNKTDTTPSTSNEKHYKPLDLSNNQTIAVSDGVTSLDIKQELDDASKASSTGNVNDNVIKMQLSVKQDGGESSTQ